MSFLPFIFSNPLILAALVALPAIWWLLRMTPPKPVVEVFPPLRILAGVLKREETPSKSPWWLTLLRMLMAAAIILAIADPVFNPRANTLSSDGPLALVIDNSWATAEDWDRRVETADALISDAESRELPVSIVMTADREHNATPTSATEAHNRLAAASPQPLQPDRLAAIEALKSGLNGTTPGTLAFISDGIEIADQKVMAELGSVRAANFRLIQGDRDEAIAVTTTANEAETMAITASRLDTAGPRTLPITAYDTRGRAIANGAIAFADGEGTARGTIAAPFELRNSTLR